VIATAGDATVSGVTGGGPTTSGGARGARRLELAERLQ